MILFVKKGILLAIDGVEPEMIRELLEAEIAALEERRHARGRSMFEKSRRLCPRLGNDWDARWASDNA